MASTNLNRRGRTEQPADSVGRSLHALQQGVDNGRPSAEARPVQEHHGAAADECEGRRRGERVGVRCRARGRCVSPTRSPCSRVPHSRVDATDGSVRDVTPRYARAFTNVTLKLRVPTSSKARKENGGDDWFAGAIRPFKRGFELVSRPRQARWTAERTECTLSGCIEYQRLTTFVFVESRPGGRGGAVASPDECSVPYVSRRLQESSQVGASPSTSSHQADPISPTATSSSNTSTATKHFSPRHARSASSRATRPSSAARTSSP